MHVRVRVHGSVNSVGGLVIGHVHTDIFTGLAPTRPAPMVGGGAMVGFGSHNTAALQAMEAAKKAAAALGLAPSGTGVAPEPDHFEEELEINDYPQHARWKATHKDRYACARIHTHAFTHTHTYTTQATHTHRYARACTHTRTHSHTHTHHRRRTRVGVPRGESGRWSRSSSVYADSQQAGSVSVRLSCVGLARER